LENNFKWCWKMSTGDFKVIFLLVHCHSGDLSNFLLVDDWILLVGSGWYI